MSVDVHQFVALIGHVIWVHAGKRPSFGSCTECLNLLHSFAIRPVSLLETMGTAQRTRSFSLSSLICYPFDSMPGFCNLVTNTQQNLAR